MELYPYIYPYFTQNRVPFCDRHVLLAVNTVQDVAFLTAVNGIYHCYRDVKYFDSTTLPLIIYKSNQRFYQNRLFRPEVEKIKLCPNIFCTLPESYILYTTTFSLALSRKKCDDLYKLFLLQEIENFLKPLNNLL